MEIHGGHRPERRAAMKLPALIALLLCAGCGPLVEVHVDEVRLNDVKAIEMKQGEQP